MRWGRLCGAIASTGVLLTTAVSTGTAAQASGFANWPQYLFSASHSSDNAAATAITTTNAASIKLAWKFSPGAAPSGLGGFYSSPVVYNGMIYIGARNGYFYAIRESTGTVAWRRYIGYVKKTTCGTNGFTATAAVGADPTTGEPTVYAYGPTGYLYALNASNGAEVWAPAAVAIPSTTVNDYYAWGSPLVFGGNVYVPISSDCDTPLVQAGVKEFSQTTGALEDTYWSTPSGTVGASIWSSPVQNGNSLFVTTGNGTNTSDGYSIVKLSQSLSKLGRWRVPGIGNDTDFGGSPGVWSAPVGGVPTKLVGACNKNGVFYALRAASPAGGPVWTLQIGNRPYIGPGTCLAAPIFDGSHLYLASNGTTIAGSAYNGSVREVDPATGQIVWETGLPGSIMGTPGMDGAGVIAAASFGSTTKHNGVFLIDAATGQIVTTIPYGTSRTFGQPVFADNYLIVASDAQSGLRAYTAG